MRTLEKMSTRFPLQSPLFLLGLFLRRLVVGRSNCCSRACLFCLISPLAIAAAMAQNVTAAQVQSAHGAQTTQTAASHCSQPGSQSHGGGWWIRSAMSNVKYMFFFLGAGFLFCPNTTWYTWDSQIRHRHSENSCTWWKKNVRSVRA